MPLDSEEIAARCDSCGFQVAKPFPSFEVADHSRCPQCGEALLEMERCDPDDLSISQLLRPGWQIDRAPRDFVCGVLEKAFRQGATGIDLRIAFTSRTRTR